MRNRLLICLLLFLLGCDQDQIIYFPDSINETKIMLDSINTVDQSGRSEIEEIEQQYGVGSQEVNLHWESIQKTDSTNLIVVTYILDTFGWLGSGEIGGTANSTLFLVIQHADHNSQKKYLPIMKQAVEKGNANPGDLALLEDRVALGKGKLQIYGSQIGRYDQTGEYYVMPLFEPEKVNKRRSRVGLGNIEDYVSYWGISWDIEKYKNDLPKWIKEQQKR